MGDPLARVRNFSSHVMMVAEHGNGKEIVGVIRGCIKTVTNGKLRTDEFPVYVKLAYILGLRVSSAHRFVFPSLIYLIQSISSFLQYMVTRI
ncbi:hypothetical protein F511_32067 [Dorcoceras hygrometricum]|uniref:Uncharacterized protein n=1 Tax=Dorcoceras hygrometricum TaxID=472368 RepID=A0A2Z7ACW1_9LAMI|nr:hypothetical protein F511_32067 [Dorcoceras hygrometricum]